MNGKKSVFIAFSMNDESSRNLFTGQRTHDGTPLEYIDLSVKEQYETDWKAKVTTRIRRSDGAIALIYANTPSSTGQIWEIQTAVAEGKPLLGIRLGDYRTKPTAMGNARCVPWTWDNVHNFIDSL